MLTTPSLSFPGARRFRAAASLMLFFGLALWAGAATVTTDRSDYQPGQWVTLTGAGWGPGETVLITITESEPVSPDGYVWPVVADSEGSFTDASFEITPVHIGIVFTLTAEGMASELTATVVFTDTMPSGLAPVNPPTGGFGIDGELFPNATAADSGDWLHGRGTPPSGSGGVVLTDLGEPMDATTTFAWVDGWGQTGSDTVFANSPVVNDDPNQWEWQTGDNPNDETDLHHAFLHFTRDAAGHTWAVLAGDRLDSARNGYIDFQLLQNRLTMTTNTSGHAGQFQSAGPHAGRTVNDLLLSFKFVGGETSPKFMAYQWRPDGSGGYRYVEVTAALPARGLLGAVNTRTLEAPYGAFGRSTYPVNCFGEAAVDLTAFLAKINPALSLDIKTIMVTTKSSKDNADLEDFAAPLQLSPSLTLGLAAEAGPDQTSCPEGDATLFPLNGSVQSAGSASIIATNWTVLSGEATIDDPGALVTTAQVSRGIAIVRLTLTTLGGGTVWDDVLLMVKEPPPCAINGPASVCRRTAGLVFSGPADMDAYAWSITGNGTLVGRPDGPTVTVNAGNACDQDFTLSLTVTKDGCTETCSAVVFTQDSETPVLTCPTGLEFTADPGTCSKTGVTWVASATDNCPGAVQVVCVPPSGSTFPVGRTTVTCTATDECGLRTEATFEVIVRDTQPPVPICAAALVAPTDRGQSTAIVEFVTDVTDNCPGATVVCIPPSGSAFAQGVTTVTCTATDVGGNSGVCTFTVTVTDGENPVVQSPADIVSQADAGQCLAGSLEFTVTATDNDRVASLTCVPPSGSSFAVGSHTVTCTATDASGNSAASTFTITVRDAEPPEVICPANIITNTAPGENTRSVAFTATVSDNCTGASVVCVPASASVFPAGITPVTCTATDAAGNTSTGTFTVTVNDREPPQITCPAGLTVNAAAGRCDQVVTFEVAATDNAPGVRVVCVPPSGSTFERGATRVHCTATDRDGNTAECSFTVTVADATPPTLSCLPARTVECGQAWDFDMPTATEACGAATIQIVSTLTNGACGQTFTAIRTWLATDAAGNTAECSQTVAVMDTTRPVITCAASKSVQCGVAWDFDMPTASDTCGSVNLSVVNTVTNAGCGTTFAALRTWMATDACGNTAECSQTVTVTDTTPPTLSCASDKSVGRSQPWDFDAPSATDSCGATTVTVAGTVTNIAPRGGSVVTRTWMAADACGNTAQCSQTVTVTNTLEITLAVEGTNGLPRAQVLVPIRVRGFTNISAVQFSLHWDGSVAEFVSVEEFGLPGLAGGNFGTGQASNGILTVSWDDPDGVCKSASDESPLFAVRLALNGAPGGSTLVRIEDEPTPLEIADENLDPVLVTVMAGQVSIDLAGPPVLQVPADMTVACDAVPAPGHPTVTSDCDPSPVVNYLGETRVDGNCPGRYTLTRTWTVTDRCGFSTTNRQVITVVDNTPPTVAHGPSQRTVELGVPWAFIEPSATDACGAVSIRVVSTVTNAGCGRAFTATRTWEITDACANPVVASQTVEVVDTTAPAVVGPANLTVPAGGSVPPAPPTLAAFLQAGGQASDLGSATLAYACVDSPISDDPCARILRRTHTVTDPCGNARSVVQTITLLSPAPAVTVALAQGQCELPPHSKLASNSVYVTSVEDPPVSFVTSTFANVPPGYLITNGSYLGWCVDYWSVMFPNVSRPVTLYRSDELLPTHLQRPYWDRVNYILNHKQGNSVDIQNAIWHFMSGPVPANDPDGYYPPSATASNLIADAEAHGAGYVPGPFDVFAVILDAGAGVQLNVVETRCARPDPSLIVGGTATFCATPTGQGPFAFQWFKGATPIPGATGECLTFTNLLLSDTGEYCVQISSPCGAATACSTLTVQDNRPPCAFTLAPTSASFWAAGGTGRIQVTANAADCAWTATANRPWVTFTSEASGTGNGEVVFNVTPSRELANREATITAGGQTIQITQAPYEPMRPTLVVLAPTGFSRVVGSQTNLLVSAQDNCGLAALELEIRAGAQTSRSRIELSEGPIHVEMPMPVELFPGTNVVSVWAVDRAGNASLVQTRTMFRVLRMPLTLLVNGSGSVTGLVNGQMLAAGKFFTVTAAPCRDCVLSNWTARVGDAGSWTVLGNAPTLTFEMQPGLALQANCVASPYLSLRGTYSGLFYEASGVRPQSSGYFTLTLGRRGYYTMELQQGSARYAGSGSFAFDGKATNVVSLAPGQDLTVEWMLDLSAAGSRQITGRILGPQGSWLAEALGDRAPVYAAGEVSPLKGRYTFILPGTHDSAVADEPMGDSFGSVQVGTNGVLTLSGLLADGEPITQSAPISADGVWPFYVPLYGGQGALLGWVHFNTNPAPAASLVSARVSWIKPAVPASTTYPGGFAIETTLEGSSYQRQADMPLLSLTNGTLSLMGGRLGQPVNACAALTPTHVVFACGAGGLTLDFVRSNGTFTGTYLLPDSTTTVRLRGVVLQRQNRGAGFFRHGGPSGQLELKARE